MPHHLGTSPVYTIQPCHSMQSHRRKVYECLAVTCHLHFRHDNQDLLRATTVTQGWNRYQNRSQHRMLTLEKKNWCVSDWLLSAVCRRRKWSWRQPSLLVSKWTTRPAWKSSNTKRTSLLPKPEHARRRRQRKWRRKPGSVLSPWHIAEASPSLLEVLTTVLCHLPPPPIPSPSLVLSPPPHSLLPVPVPALCHLPPTPSHSLLLVPAVCHLPPLPPIPSS